jgi:hypothetical protein
MKPYCNPISRRSHLAPLTSHLDCLLGYSLFAIRYSLLCVLCVLCVSPSPAATINFQLERFTGHTNNRPITISLASDPLAQTTNIVFGVPTTLQPTNSRASIVLLPANYWVKIDQVPTPMFMPVPDSTNVYNAVDLIRDGLKHLIIKTNFVIIDTNALSSYLLTNGDGSSLTGLYFIPLTNGVAHGTTNIVTDSFGDVWSFDGISWRDITVGGLPQAQFLSGSYTLNLPMSLSGTDGGQLTISENDANTANLFQVRSNGVIIAYIDSASILNFSQGNITNLYSTIVNLAAAGFTNHTIAISDSAGNLTPFTLGTGLQASGGILSVNGGLTALAINNGANLTNIFQAWGSNAVTGVISNLNGGAVQISATPGSTSIIVDNDGVTVSGGLKNTAFTPNTIVKANGSSYAVSIPNGSGALTNNGSGVFGWYPGFLDSVSNDWLGSFTGDGSGLTNLNATSLSSGTVPAARMPALTGDVTTSAGSVATTLKNTGTAGTYTKITFDAQGRETSGTTLSAGDIPAIPESGVTSLVTDLSQRQLTNETRSVNWSGSNWMTGAFDFDFELRFTNDVGTAGQVATSAGPGKSPYWSTPTVSAQIYSNQTVTIAGTANQVISSAGAQDLTANRTWTLSTPQNIDTAAAVRFARLGLGVAADGTVPLSIYEAIATAAGASGIQLSNLNPATVGSQAYSPFIRLAGAGWKTASTAASQPVLFDIGVVPVQGSANPTALLVISNSINGGAFTEVMRLSSAGAVTFPSTVTGGLYSGSAVDVTGNINAGTANSIDWTSRAAMRSPADGEVSIMNSALSSTNVGITTSGLFLGGDKTAAIVRDSASLLTATNLTASGSYAGVAAGGFFQQTNSAPGSLTLTAGSAYVTNLTANVTLTAFASVPNNLLWSIYLWATNNSGGDKTITFPSGTKGQPGQAVPPVYYVTNNAGAEFQINGWGNTVTNVNWSPH